MPQPVNTGMLECKTCGHGFGGKLARERFDRHAQNLGHDASPNFRFTHLSELRNKTDEKHEVHHD